MEKEIGKQFEVVERLLRQEAEVHAACIEFTKLMRMMFEYINKKNIERYCNETDERTGCF